MEMTSIHEYIFIYTAQMLLWQRSVAPSYFALFPFFFYLALFIAYGRNNFISAGEESGGFGLNAAHL